MKKVFVFLLISFIATSTFAQFNFGIKGGVNLNRLVMEEEDLQSEDLTISPVGGLFFRFKANDVSLTPEILYSQKSSSFSMVSDSINTSYKLSYIDVPVIIGLHFANFSINTGPVISFLFDEEINFEKADNSFSASLSEDIFNEMNFGWQAGIGIEIRQIMIAARYEFSVGDLMKEVTIPNTKTTMQPDIRNSIFQVTLGIKFLKIVD